MTSSRRCALRVLAVALVLLVLAVIAARVAFASYLGSDAFHVRIALATGRAFKADAQLMPLHRSGATLYTDGLEARGGPGAFFSNLRADEIRALCNWRGILHRRWQIDELSAQHLAVTFANREPVAAAPSSRPATEVNDGHGWPVDVRRIAIRDSRWQWSGGGISGASLTLTPDDAAWIIDGSGGKLTQAAWPELQLESARLRYTRSALWITQSELRAGTGRIAVTGEVNFDRAANLQATIDRIDVAPLLAPDWRARLSGNLSGTVKIQRSLAEGGDLQVSGSLQMSEAQITALPVLDQIATFTRSGRFRRISLTNASLDFTRNASGTVEASHVVLEAEGLLRVEGAFRVVSETIDGQFQVGVTSASLQWLPGAQARVFTTARGGYQWTTLRVQGPLAHPREDLTPRLLAAAAGQLLDDPGATAIDAFRSLLDLVPR